MKALIESPVLRRRASGKGAGRSGAKVPARGAGMEGKAEACACGGGCPKCNASPVTLRGEIQTPVAQQEDGSGPDFGGDEQPLDTSACPVNAFFLSNVAGGNSKVNCQVPTGKYGFARLAQYRLGGVSPIPSGGAMVGEKFTAIEDPHSKFNVLTPRTATTDANGIFDDCYALASPDPLPSDFVLKVEQNHLYEGTVISKNIITYRSGDVDVRHCHRVPNSCSFSNRCGLA